jgi:hypothetical protein
MRFWPFIAAHELIEISNKAAALGDGDRYPGFRRDLSTALKTVDHPHAAAEHLDNAIVRDGLADHHEDAWLSGRFILRTRHSLVNE